MHAPRYLAALGGAVVMMGTAQAQEVGNLLVDLSQAKEKMLTTNDRRVGLNHFLPARTDYNTALSKLMVKAKSAQLPAAVRKLIEAERAWAAKFVVRLQPGGGQPVNAAVLGPELTRDGASIKVKTADGLKPYVSPAGEAAAIGPVAVVT